MLKLKISIKNNNINTWQELCLKQPYRMELCEAVRLPTKVFLLQTEDVFIVTDDLL